MGNGYATRGVVVFHDFRNDSVSSRGCLPEYAGDLPGFRQRVKIARNRPAAGVDGVLPSCPPHSRVCIGVIPEYACPDMAVICNC
jgi:hypothetical protein